jgi:protein regulator of cytokinesis 1
MGSADHQDNRRLQLLQDFVDLHWLHVELALPPLPNAAGSHSFPIELLPDKRNEETPGAYQAYEKVLGQFIANFHEVDVEREEKIMDEGEDEDDDETYLGRVVDIKGLRDLQPEVGLMNWINELSNLVCQSP